MKSCETGETPCPLADSPELSSPECRTQNTALKTPKENEAHSPQQDYGVSAPDTSSSAPRDGVLNPLRGNKSYPHIPKGSFLRKAFLSFLVLVLLVTVLLTVFLTTTYLRTSVKLISQYNNKLIAQSNYSITYLDDMVKRLRDVLMADKNIVAFLNMPRNNPYTAMLASQTIDKHAYPSSEIDSIFLYNAHLDLFYSSATGEQKTSVDFSDLEIAALLKDTAFVEKHNGRPIATHVSPVTHTAKMCTYIIFEHGYADNGLRNALVVNIKTAALTNSIKGINQSPYPSDTSFLVVDERSAVLGMSLAGKLESTQIIELGKEVEALTATNTIRKLGGAHYLLSCDKSNANNWYILGLTPVNTVFKDVLSAAIVALILVVVVFAACAALCLFLARRLSSPIYALTQIMKGSKDSEEPQQIDTEEFQNILSMFQNMQEQNRTLDKLKSETGYAAKQDFLNALLSESISLSTEQTSKKLAALHLNYITSRYLCMCLFKIDRYSEFTSQNNQKERWAMRYAVCNIAGEIGEGYGDCEIFCCDHDKFIMLLDVGVSPNFNTLQVQIERLLLSIQQKIKEYLQISLSVAYSTPFQGLVHLPSMYNNMKDSIQLKIRYGHGCIINPYRVDDIATEDFHIPLKKEEQLIQRVLEGDFIQARDIYRSICQKLYQYSYNEIISCEVHLIYSIYSVVIGKRPALKGNTDFVLQSFLHDIQNAEVGEDLDLLMEAFLRRVCEKVSQASAEHQPGSDLVVLRVVDVVEKEFSDPGLCLSSISEELRLSPNYIGYLFKSARQQSVSQYIFELRMQKLDAYMRTSKLSLTAILNKIGLEKNNYFYTRFKKHFGISLGEYRLQLSAGEKTEDG